MAGTVHLKGARNRWISRWPVRLDRSNLMDAVFTTDCSQFDSYTKDATNKITTNPTGPLDNDVPEEIHTNKRSQRAVSLFLCDD